MSLSLHTTLSQEHGVIRSNHAKKEGENRSVTRCFCTHEAKKVEMAIFEGHCVGGLQANSLQKHQQGRT
jgi:hypothetical protein